MANALSVEKQRTKLSVTQLCTFELCHLLSILCMHIINPIWLHGKEIISLNGAVLELTSSVLISQSLIAVRLDEVSQGLSESFCKSTGVGEGRGEKRLAKRKHPHVSCYI